MTTYSVPVTRETATTCELPAGQYNMKENVKQKKTEKKWQEEAREKKTTRNSVKSITANQERQLLFLEI